MPYTLTNKYGTETFRHASKLFNTTHVVSAACLPLYTESLGWANANYKSITNEPLLADNIIIQCCQRSDLAILKALKLIKQYKSQYVGKNIMVTGCLSKRFDVKLPKGVQRLSPLLKNRQHLTRRHLVERKDMFLGWGELFDSFYPLRVGSGGIHHSNPCNGYSIRPIKSELDSDYTDRKKCMDEAQETTGPIVIVADRPTPSQISNWLRAAVFMDKDIALYNLDIEDIFMPGIEEEIMIAAQCRRLVGFHVQLRSAKASILSDYGMSVSKVHRLLMLVEKLKKYQVFRAADVVIKYKWEHDSTLKRIKSTFDMIRWEPYWDGKWLPERAQARYLIYTHPQFDWTTG